MIGGRVQYADPKMAGLIKEGPSILRSAYCTNHVIGKFCPPFNSWPYADRFTE